jgi:hypothetical protein
MAKRKKMTPEVRAMLEDVRREIRELIEFLEAKRRERPSPPSA